MIVHFMRHGDVHNPESVLYGRIPGYGLSEEGQKQAAATGKHVSDWKFTTLYCSPLQRAQETMAIVRQHLKTDVDLIIADEITESNVAYQGEPIKKIFDIGWDRIYRDIDPQKGYESFEDVGKRIVSWLNNIASRHDETDEVLAVSHGDPILCAWIFANCKDFSIDMRATNAEQFYPSKCSVLSLHLPSSQVHQPLEHEYWEGLD
eukprot:Clim_evm65s150 gene=Clim_evmTU65s150